MIEEIINFGQVQTQNISENSKKFMNVELEDDEQEYNISFEYI